jgi:hypothetical protein
MKALFHRANASRLRGSCSNTTAYLINHSVMALRAHEFIRDHAHALSLAPRSASKSKVAAQRLACHQVCERADDQNRC